MLLLLYFQQPPSPTPLPPPPTYLISLERRDIFPKASYPLFLSHFTIWSLKYFHLSDTSFSTLRQVTSPNSHVQLEILEERNLILVAGQSEPLGLEHILGEIIVQVQHISFPNCLYIGWIVYNLRMQFAHLSEEVPSCSGSFRIFRGRYCWEEMWTRDTHKREQEEMLIMFITRPYR